MLSIFQRFFKREGDLIFVSRNEFRSERELGVGVDVGWEKKIV